MQPQPQFEPYISPEEAAKFLAVPRERVVRLAREGKLPAYPIDGGKHRQWRFLKSTLDEYMKSRSNVRQPSVPARKVS